MPYCKGKKKYPWHAFLDRIQIINLKRKLGGQPLWPGSKNTRTHEEGGKGNRKPAEAQRSDVTDNRGVDYTALQPDISNHQATTEPNRESSTTWPVPRNPTPDGRAHQNEHSAQLPR